MDDAALKIFGLSLSFGISSYFSLHDMPNGRSKRSAPIGPASATCPAQAGETAAPLAPPSRMLSLRKFYRLRGSDPFPDPSTKGSLCSTELTTKPYGFC